MRKGIRPDLGMKLFATLLLILATVFAVHSYAGSATWNIDANTGNWNDPLNWTPATVPNGPDDVATFDVSNTTSILSGTEEVSGILFNPGASAFTITVYNLTISGSGVTNSSDTTQKFLVSLSSVFLGDHILTFSNNAIAGSNTEYTAHGTSQQAVDGGEIHFNDSSSAGFAVIQIQGGSDNGAAALFFNDFSTAGNATIVNYGGGHGSKNGGFIDFLNSTPTAGDASISSLGGTASGAAGAFTAIANGGNATIATYGGSVTGAGGGVTFLNNAAENATLIIYGGTNGGDGGYIFFGPDASADSAHFQIYGNGLLDFANFGSPTAVGSIEGDGLILLPGRELMIGTNNLTTTFHGVVQSPGPGLGSLTKVGSGTLTLTGANTYSGGTTVSEGSFVIRNSSGSGTGTGPVQVNEGTLGGGGTIAGAVTIGDNDGARAFLAPAAGSKRAATLNVFGALILNADATYSCTAKGKSDQVRSDQVKASGVTITGATFSFHI